MKKLLTIQVILALALLPIGAAFADLNNGLVAYYPFNGNAVDQSGNGNDGSVNGATLSEDSCGNPNAAYSFDGVDDYIDFTENTNLDSFEAFSVSIWIRPDNEINATSPRQDFLYKGPANRTASWVLIHEGGFIVFQVHSNSDWYKSSVVKYSGVFPANQSFNVIIVYDGSPTLRMYINGSEEGQHKCEPAGCMEGLFYDNSYPLTAGRRPDNRYHFDGSLDDIRIYNRALTALEIEELTAEGCTFVDTDGDGIPDDEDVCPGGDDTIDTDVDTVPDFCDPCPNDPENDADGDGYCGDVDICPGGDDGQNVDGDSLPDFCDVCPDDPENDADGDGLCESDDNCPNIANPNQTDTDWDGAGDVCDPDIDDDGVVNPDDNCPYDTNSGQEDLDGDGVGDACDDDIDGDGVIDADDACLPTPVGEVVDANGCSISQLCPCEHPVGGDKWKNHGAYVSCVAHAAEDFVAVGLITEPEKDATVSAAAGSACGQKIK